MYAKVAPGVFLLVDRHCLIDVIVHLRWAIARAKRGNGPMIANNDSLLALKALLIFLTIGLGAMPANARTIHVPADSTTIQGGIEGARSGDTVLVADGVYTGERNRDINFYSRQILLQSENGPEFTSIDCGGSAEINHRAFYFCSRETAAVEVNGFTICNGYAVFKGGAILIEDSSPTIKNCIFKNNFGHHGGGVYITFDANPTFENCRFEDNITGDVGTIHARFGCCALFKNCLFTGNTAKNGIFLCYNSSPTIIDCQFIANRTELTGGAVFLQDDSSPTFEDCLFKDNVSGGRGGAVFIEERGFQQSICEPVFTRSIFVGNQADSGGAAYIAGPARPVFENCTMYGNSATTGGALLSVNTDQARAILTKCAIINNRGETALKSNGPGFSLFCCDVFGNENGDWIEPIADQMNANGNFSLAPRFVNEEAGDFRPSRLSPCCADNNSCRIPIGALDCARDDSR